MRKYSLVVATLAVLLTTATTPVLAQEEGVSDSGAMGVPYGEPLPPDPPDFVLEEDGTVIIDGDTAFDCRSFALAREDGYFRGGNQEQALSVLQQCEEGGFLRQGDLQTLPDTGGPSGAALLLPAGGLFLITSLVCLKMIGRHS